MKKIFKILLLTFATLLLLLVLAGFLVAKFIDTEWLKGKISYWVHEQTGRNLVISGKLERSVFPWIGARVHGVQLSNPSGFGSTKPFLEIEEMDIRVKFWPLLSHKFEIGKVTLKDAVLHLTRNKEGRANWQGLMIHKSVSHVSPSKEITHTSTTKSANVANLISIAGVNIHNANILYVNEQTGQTLNLTHLKLESDNPTFTESFPLRLEFDISSSRPHMKGHFKLRSNVLVNLAKQTLEFSNIKFSNDNFLVRGDIKGRQLLHNPTFTGHLQITNFNLKYFLKTLGKEIHTEDPTALRKVSASAYFEGSASSLKLDPLSINLDGALIQGSYNMVDFASQSSNFDLTVNQLNLDRYLPPNLATATPKSSSGLSSQVSSPSVSSASSSSSKFKLMKKSKMNGTLRVNELTVSKTPLNHFYAQIAAENGVLQLDPLNVDAYQGTARGKVIIEMCGNVPRYRIDEVLSNINIKQLLQSDRLIGKANVKLHLISEGESKIALLRNLNGSAYFNIKDGAFLGVNFPYEVERVLALLTKKPLPAAPAKNQTDFGEFMGTGDFNDGVFINNDFLMKSSQFKMTGTGTLNCLTHALNYHLLVGGLHKIVNSKGISVEEERQTKIPILVTGTLNKVIIAPDLTALLKEQAKHKIQQAIQQEIDDKLKGELGDTVKEGLKTLFTNF